MCSDTAVTIGSFSARCLYYFLSSALSFVLCFHLYYLASLFVAVGVLPCAFNSYAYKVCTIEEPASRLTHLPNPQSWGRREDIHNGNIGSSLLLRLEDILGVVFGEAVTIFVYAQNSLALVTLVHGSPLELHHTAHNTASLGARLREVVRIPRPIISAATSLVLNYWNRTVRLPSKPLPTNFRKGSSRSRLRCLCSDVNDMKTRHLC